MMKISVFALLLISTFAYADESLSTKIHNQYTSIRAMGMGNAFTAVADDYSLMFYNPAGFAKKRYNEVQFSVVGVGFSPKTKTLMDDITKASASGTESEKAAAVSGVLDQYYGKTLGGSVQAAEIFWTRKNWGVAILPANLTIDMSFNRQLGPAIDLNVIGDTSIAYGYGKDINKFIAGGITAKYIHRVSVDRSVSALELASDPNILSTKRFKEGTSIDFDIGFLWTPNWFNSKTDSATAPVTTKNSEEVTLEKTDAPDAKTTDTKVNETSNKEKKPSLIPEGDLLPDPAAEEKRSVQAEPNSLVVTTISETASSNTAKADAKKIETPTAVSTTVPAALPAAPTGTDPVKTPVVETAKKNKGKKLKEKAKTEVAAVPAPVEKFPLTFGLVFRNILGGSFTQSKMVNKDATEVPNKMNFLIDAGTQYEISKFGDLTLRSMVDFKNILHPDISLTKSLHAGLEFDYYPNSWFKSQIRGGMNQMYYTAGVTFLFGIIHIDALTYGEEVGTSKTKIENRVYAAKLGFNF